MEAAHLRGRRPDPVETSDPGGPRGPRRAPLVPGVSARPSRRGSPHLAPLEPCSCAGRMNGPSLSILVTNDDGVGTPADCVQLAVGTLLERRPDLVVSGINLGPNTGMNIIYSGTVSAATEARLLGIPSISISIGTFKDPLWETAASYAERFARLVLKNGLPPKVLLNVNVPSLPLSDVKGVRVTHQGDSGYIETFDLKGDPASAAGYLAAGDYEMRDTDETTDALALSQGFVSVTPVTCDLTAYDML